MAEQKFQPGFRLSAIDVVVLVVGGVAVPYAMSVDRWFGIAIAFVVLHFFLFCNVLRMSRPLELIWASIFAALAIASSSFDLLPWPAVFAISGAATVVVAVIEARRPSYHGVGWQKLNPRLPEWWESTADGESIMDKEEAVAVLDEHLASFVRRSYAELAAIVDQPQSAHANGPSGAAYQIEFNVFYDSGRCGDLRIMGSIDDGGWRAIAPLTKSEIMKPTGELVK